MDTNERDLLKQLKNGRLESFDTLYKNYSRKLFSLAFRMCGNREDADDIVQRVFIQAIKNIGSFKEESSIYTWLYAIARNLCLRLLEKRKKNSFASLDELVNSVPPQDSSEYYRVEEKQYYIQQVKEGCLTGLLKCLSFYQRMAFILNVLLDVKEYDVAVILDKSETAVRLLVHRARKNIRAFLCKNCSLYQPANPCHCENLIDFSLKQGWIHQMPVGRSVGPPAVAVQDIETEIDELKKITLLYRSLGDYRPSDSIADAVKEELNKQRYIIFNQKKVK